MDSTGQFSPQLDPVLDKAADQATESNSLLPLLKVEINAKIKLRRPNLSTTDEVKTPFELTKDDLRRREIVRKRNIHHARMSRMRKKRVKETLEKTVELYEAENARLVREMEHTRSHVQILKTLLQTHTCSHRHLQDTDS